MRANAREPVKSFRGVARLCFYRHNPFKFWTVLSDLRTPDDEAGNVIQTREHKGDFQRTVGLRSKSFLIAE
jgi:hypothetical protein